MIPGFQNSVLNFQHLSKIWDIWICYFIYSYIYFIIIILIQILSFIWSMENHDLRADWESWLVGKVCDLYKVLEIGISVVLTVKSGLGILFD
jgi:hypothetical protein